MSESVAWAIPRFTRGPDAETGIDLEKEIVSSRHDKGCGFYTIERDGKRWTAMIQLAELNRHGEDKLARRRHLISALDIAMRGEPDEPVISPRTSDTTSISEGGS
jgi:hypothetical protein